MTGVQTCALPIFEPDAGPLEARIYLLPRKQVQPFVASLAQPPAPGWTIEQPPERQADGSLLERETIEPTSSISRFSAIAIKAA